MLPRLLPLLPRLPLSAFSILACALALEVDALGWGCDPSFADVVSFLTASCNHYGGVTHNYRVALLCALLLPHVPAHQVFEQLHVVDSLDEGLVEGWKKVVDCVADMSEAVELEKRVNRSGW